MNYILYLFFVTYYNITLEKYINHNIKFSKIYQLNKLNLKVNNKNLIINFLMNYIY